MAKSTKNTEKEKTAPVEEAAAAAEKETEEKETEEAKEKAKKEVNPKDSAKSQQINKLMNRHGVAVLFENSKGEFFTSENLALNSEKGDKTKVKTHKK